MSDRSVSRRYGAALILGLIALGVDFVVYPWVGHKLFFISTAAVVASAVSGGFGPGIFTTLVTAVGLNFYVLYLKHFQPIRIESSQDLLRLFLFLTTGLLVTSIASALRTSLTVASASKERAEQATRARDEIIAVVSHELKTPLTSLRLRTDLEIRKLKRNDLEGFNPEEHQRFLDSTLETLGRLENLINDMLDISSIQYGKLRIEREQVELGNVLQGVVDHLSNEIIEKNCRVFFNTSSKVVGVWDPNRLGQVFSNLLSNAIKYGQGQPIELGFQAREGLVQAFVRDHGPGISHADAEKLFQRFERLSPVRTISGTGLGLYISRKIVELHHGKIWVESIPGTGATFWVELPLLWTDSSRTARPRQAG